MARPTRFRPTTRSRVLAAAAAGSLGGAVCALGLALLAPTSGCDAPSSNIDGGDLMGVFERDGGASDGGIVSLGTSSASVSARPRTSAPALVPVERHADGQSCVSLSGSPAEVPKRVPGRPACRGGDIFEYRDADGAPRYGCLFSPLEADKRGPLPLLVYFHGDTPGLDDPSSMTKLTGLHSTISGFDFSHGEVNKPDPAAPPALPGQKGIGYYILAIQGRALHRHKSTGLSFDTEYTGPDNVDRATTDHFLDQAIGKVSIDKRRIYAVGTGTGGTMAATYAMVRADLIAGFASYAAPVPTARWTCPGPPPPGAILYRSCDALSSCDEADDWVVAREKARAETLGMRLGDGIQIETNCLDKSQCGDKHGRSNHELWPKQREKEMLRFLAQHVLSE